METALVLLTILTGAVFGTIAGAFIAAQHQLAAQLMGAKLAQVLTCCTLVGYVAGIILALNLFV